MKTYDELLLEEHGEKDFNYYAVKRAMHRAVLQRTEHLFPLIFKGQQWLIWQELDRLPRLTGYIATELGLPSKNVTKQLTQMAKTGLIKETSNGKFKSWSKV